MHLCMYILFAYIGIVLLYCQAELRNSIDIFMYEEEKEDNCIGNRAVHKQILGPVTNKIFGAFPISFNWFLLKIWAPLQIRSPSQIYAQSRLRTALTGNIIFMHSSVVLDV